MFTRTLRPPQKSFFLFGPRGTGKSTWLQKHFKNAVFYDLLNNQEIIRLSRKPSLLYEETSMLPPKSWVVIDEIQKVPQLLDEVHRLIESKKLLFALSGSSARKLKRGAKNLLAGRARMLKMFPLTSFEVKQELSLKKILSLGMLPSVLIEEDPEEFLKSYAETYLQEEIMAEALTRNLGGFARFLEIAARQNGQITSVANIARDAQVARQTVQGYFDLLIDTLMGFWLPAWKLKRATKQIAHPKFYFFDPGICRSLSGRLPYPLQPEEMGHLFETFILHEIRAYLHYSKKDYPVFFWSSHDKVEIDLFLETQNGYQAIEMKSVARWEKKYNRGLKRIQTELKLKDKQLLGIYSGERTLVVENVNILPFQKFLKQLWLGKIII